MAPKHCIGYRDTFGFTTVPLEVGDRNKDVLKCFNDRLPTCLCCIPDIVNGHNPDHLGIKANVYFTTLFTQGLIGPTMHYFALANVTQSAFMDAEGFVDYEKNINDVLRGNAGVKMSSFLPSQTEEPETEDPVVVLVAVHSTLFSK